PGQNLRWSPSQLDIHSGTAKFDLTIELDDRPAGIIGRIEYSRDLFDEGTITRLIEHFQTLLAGIAADPAEKIARLPFLSEAEKRQMLVEWNTGPSRKLHDQCLRHLFEAQVEKTPNAKAVICPWTEDGEGQHLSYRELNQRANALAHHLIGLGVGPETLVGVALDRSIEMVIALLGIVKAGGAYLPLDPGYPQARLDYMLADCQAKLLLTTTDRKDLVGAAIETVLLDRLLPLLATDADARTANLPPLDHTDHLAYVMYTSGSTGTPKGIAVTQQAVIRLVCDPNYIRLSAGKRMAQMANISFDAATFEVWGALLNGGELVILPREVTLSPALLEKVFAEQRIDAVFLTTALFNQIVSEAPRAFGHLQDVLFGGESCDPQRVREVLAEG